MPSSLTDDQEGFLNAICGSTSVQFLEYGKSNLKSGSITVTTNSASWSIVTQTGWGSTVTLTNSNAAIERTSFTSTADLSVGEMLIKNSESSENTKIVLTPAGAEVITRNSECKDFTTSEMLEFDDSNNPQCSSPNITGDISNLFFFKGNDGEHGEELWKTDGTESGTVMVKDIENGSQSSYPYGFLRDEINGVVYFTAENNEGKQIWQTDGTEQGTNTIASFGHWDTGDTLRVMVKSGVRASGGFPV